jgi:nucleoside-diphosphate-sugar epimerase
MEAYWLAAKKGKVGEIYNIGGNKIISVKQFLKELIKLARCKIKCSVDKKLLRPQDVTLQIPDVRKFNKDTGWKPKVSFDRGVNLMLKDISKWKDAPLWDSKKIKKATKIWFKYLD